MKNSQNGFSTVRTIALLIVVAGVGGLFYAKSGTSSKENENKEVVSRFAEEFKNKANHNIVDELFAENFTHHFKDPRLPAGRPTMKLLGQSVVAAFPDVHATVEDLLADGDKVIERTTATGTHKGTFNGIPATDRKVTWTEIHIYELKDGKIVELWSEIDFLSILGQIGPAPASQ